MGADEKLQRRLVDAGLSDEVASSALALDAILQRWRRRASKRLPERLALDAMGVDLDIARLDVLTAILAPGGEFEREGDEEPMVATVASRLGIDPSRASRLVSDLIASGHARRAVSQRDARRTIVELTDAGREVVTEVRARKIAMLGAFLSDWTEREIATFVPLLDRFSAWSEQNAPANAQVPGVRPAASAVLEPGAG
jgi:DNA-binding MarR family transcriptional regulator